MKIEINGPAAGVRLDKLVVERVDRLGRAGAKRLFDDGNVRIQKAGESRWRRAAKGDVGAEGDVVEVRIDDTSDAAQPDESAALNVVLETDQVIVVEKPAGQPSAPIEAGERGTLANALVARYPEMKEIGFSPREPGLCHRLDNGTSGLLVAARTRAAFDSISGALKEGRLDKRYLLICKDDGLPESGTIDVPLAPHPKDRRRVLACVHPRDVARNAPRPATTTYKKLETHGAYALVEASAAKAGRHQIRAHFAAIEHPLLGDALYGDREDSGLSRHALHAASITWKGDAIVPAFTVTSPLPADLVKVLEQA